MEDFQQVYGEWKEAISMGDRQRAHDILVAARKRISDKKIPGRWDWFRDSLRQGGERCYFALAVLHQHSIPKALLPEILRSGFRYADASTIKDYVVPCIKTFGRERIDQMLSELSKEFEDGQAKYKMARYWYGAAKSKR